jgi:hypothetical protein
MKGAKGREKVLLVEGVSDDVDDVRRKVEELEELKNCIPENLVFPLRNL